MSNIVMSFLRQNCRVGILLCKFYYILKFDLAVNFNLENSFAKCLLNLNHIAHFDKGMQFALESVMK